MIQTNSHAVLAPVQSVGTVSRLSPFEHLSKVIGITTGAVPNSLDRLAIEIQSLCVEWENRAANDRAVQDAGFAVAVANLSRAQIIAASRGSLTRNLAPESGPAF